MDAVEESRYNVWVALGAHDYVFNGVSGALLRTPRGTRDDVAGFGAGALPQRTSMHHLERMTRGRMLVSDGADELGVLAARYSATQVDTSHLALTLVTSLGCNFECPYCFEDKHPSVMGSQVQQAVLDLVDERLPLSRGVYVTWFGGEPLVGRSALFPLAERLIARCDAADVHYDSGIITNGYLLDESTCRQLRAVRVTSAQVSIDGPAETHDRMRPLAGGRPSFERIIANLRHAVDHLEVCVRVNADRTNLARVEELLQRLEAEGLAGKLTVYPGQIVGGHEATSAPAGTFGATCYSNAEFAAEELRFVELATRYGFADPSLPRPSGAPCTAVRTNDLVIGSEGELYKCWESVGNPRHVIGSVLDRPVPDTGRTRWSAYDPFSDPDCRSCIALPVCMGGCAHHAFDLLQREHRCDTFRHNYVARVTAFVEHARRDTETPVAAPVPGDRRVSR